MTTNIVELIRQRDELNARIQIEAATALPISGPGVYKTRHGGTATIYACVHDQWVGAITHGGVKHVIAAAWDADGLFNRKGGASVCDIAERIGDLP